MSEEDNWRNCSPVSPIPSLSKMKSTLNLRLYTIAFASCCAEGSDGVDIVYAESFR